MEFRMDFFFRILMDLAYYGAQLVFYKILFIQIGQLGGWDFDQALIFVAGSMIVDAIAMTVFANNLWWFPILVNQGDLDNYLTRPVSSLFFLLFRDFAANSFLNLLCAAGIFIWALLRFPGDIAWSLLPVYLILLVAGAWMHALVHLIIVLPVFWTHGGMGFHDLFYNFARFMERPDRIYTGWVRKVVTWVLPFAVMTSFPARWFLEGAPPQILFHIIGVVVLLTTLAFTLWRLGLRSYASASS
jgi:ABC-2 type transport system permease protein